MNARTIELIKRYRDYAWQRYNLIVKNYFGISHVSSTFLGPSIFNQPKNYGRQSEMIIIDVCANSAAGAK